MQTLHVSGKYLDSQGIYKNITLKKENIYYLHLRIFEYIRHKLLTKNR